MMKIYKFRYLPPFRYSNVNYSLENNLRNINWNLEKNSGTLSGETFVKRNVDESLKVNVKIKEIKI